MKELKIDFSKNSKIIVNAIGNLVNCGFSITDNKVIFDEETEINIAQIQAKIKELQIEETKKEIENRATNFVKAQLSELDYDNEGEVALYATNEKSEWNAEAKALQLWVEKVYKKMYELEDSVTADNYETIDLDKIEAEYPKFEFKGDK